MEVKASQKRIFTETGIKFEIVRFNINPLMVAIKELDGCQITRNISIATIEKFSQLI